MSAMPCRTKPAFIVEGDLEQVFIQNACPGCAVRKIGCNGDDVSIQAIAKRIGTLGRLLQRKYDLLIVVFDREKRVETCEQLETALRDALEIEFLTATVVIGIPDRDIESWMLADPERMRECIGPESNAEVSTCEGRKGKSQIKLLMSKKGPYVETVHGPAWLKRARRSELERNSKSFARFVTLLRDLDCWWLAGPQDKASDNREISGDDVH